MTSLSKQLERLAIPLSQIQILDADSRSRASLIFDCKEAANIDKQTALALGQAGLEELIVIDDGSNDDIVTRFEPFEQLLFSTSSMDWSRPQQTKEAISRVDEAVNKYLALVSPFLQTSAARKTIEWLIYRFNIHLFNTDDLMRAALPHFDTPIFVKFIQLLQDLPPSVTKSAKFRWKFLLDHSKNGVPLSLEALVYHCLVTPSFVEFICESVPFYFKIHGNTARMRSVCNFTTIAAFAVLSTDNTDRLFHANKIPRVLLAALAKGLRRDQYTQWTATCIALFSRLVQVTVTNGYSLPVEQLEALISLCTKLYANKDYEYEIIAVLSIIFNFHKDIDMSNEVFERIAINERTPAYITQCHEKFKMKRFADIYIARLIPSSSHERNESKISQLQDMVNAFDLIEHDIYALLMFLLRWRLSRPDDLSYEKVARKFMSILDRRQSSTLERVVVRLMSELDGNLLKLTNDLLTLTHASIRYTMSSQEEHTSKKQCIEGATSADNQTLYLSLINFNPLVRRQAVVQLRESLVQRKFLGGSGDKVSEEEVNFVKPVINTLLKDTDPTVIVALLQFSTEFLCHMIGENEFVASCMKIIRKKQVQHEWYEVVVSIMAHFSKVDLSLTPILGIQMLPIFTVNPAHEKAQSALVGRVLRSAVVKRDPYLKLMAEALELNEEVEPAKVVTPGKKNKHATSKKRRNIDEDDDDLEPAQPQKSVDCYKLKKAVKTSMKNYLIHNLCHIVKMTDDLISYEENSGALNLTELTCKSLGQLSRERLVKGKHVNSMDVGSVCLAIINCCRRRTKLVKFMCGDLLNVVAFIMADEYKHPEIYAIFVSSLRLLEQEALVGVISRADYLAFFTGLGIEQVCNLLGRAIIDDNESSVSAAVHLTFKWSISGEVVSVNPDLPPQNVIIPCILLGLASVNRKNRNATAHLLTCVVNKIAALTLNCVAGDLLIRIEKQKEECIADRNHIIQMIGNYFTRSVAKLSPEITGCLEYLLELTTEEYLISSISVRFLEVLSAIPAKYTFEYLADCAKKAMSAEEDASPHSHTVKQLNTFIGQYRPETVEHLCSDVAFYIGFLRDPRFQENAISALKKPLWDAIPVVGIQQQILAALIDVSLKEDTPTSLVTSIRNTLKKLKLTTAQIESELEIPAGVGTAAAPASSTDSPSRGTRSSQRRSCVRSTPVATPVTVRSLRIKDKMKCMEFVLPVQRINFLLEIVQGRGDKVKVKDDEFQHEKLSEILFNVLSKLLESSDSVDENEVSARNDSSVYCIQLVLSLLQSICSTWKVKPKRPSSFNIESLVKCIRSSNNRQSQQQALLLMAAGSLLLPELILHHVMAMFAFVGNSLLRHDDVHTFRVIDTTIDTIIPVIIQNDRITSISDVLRVFIDARHHVPRHRIQPLYRRLIEVIGPGQHLVDFMLLTLESSVRISTSKDKPTCHKNIDLDIDFLVNICNQFSCAHNVAMMSRLVEGLATLKAVSLAKRDNAAIPKIKAADKISLLQLNTLNLIQVRKLQYHIARAIVALLSSDDFAVKVLSNKDPVDFDILLQDCLIYINVVNDTSVNNANTLEGDLTAKFNRSVIHKTYEILEKVNYLLSFTDFIRVFITLVKHDQIDVRKKSLELLAKKLVQIQDSKFTACQSDAILTLLDVLVAEVKTSFSLRDEPKYLMLLQLAMYALKIITKLFCKANKQYFLKALELCTDMLRKSCPTPLMSSIILTIAELVTELGLKSIGYLQSFVPPIINIIHGFPVMSIEQFKKSEMVLVCAMTCLHRICTTMTNFLSPYLLDIIYALCLQVNVGEKATDKGKIGISLRLNAIVEFLSTQTQVRVLLPNIETSLDKILMYNQSGIIMLMEILRKCVKKMSKDEINQNANFVYNILILATDVRNHEDVTLDENDISKLEDKCIEVILCLVVRLSENIFRPIFYTFYDWACKSDDDACRNRRLFFFKACNKLSDHLKSIFNLFVNHTIKIAMSTLADNASLDKDSHYYPTDDANACRKSCDLVENIMSFINNAMMYDTDGFVDVEVTNLLKMPLIDQLENFIGTPEQCKNRLMNFTIPTISQLAVASRDDTAAKSINYEILLKCRHESHKVRYSCLKAIEDLSTKLGEEYMILIPETIPFLSELMEDESEEVENLCKDVVITMEQQLGQSLQKYF